MSLGHRKNREARDAVLAAFSQEFEVEGFGLFLRRFWTSFSRSTVAIIAATRNTPSRTESIVKTKD